MANHSAVRVMLRVFDLERLLREADESHRQYQTRTGSKDGSWEHWFAQYIINRLAAKDLSCELFDPGSTSNQITESGDIVPPQIDDP
jgi:hypothetical protein